MNMSNIPKVPNGCRVDFARKRIITPRGFYDRASLGREPEYSALIALSDGFPGFSVAEKPFYRRRSAKATLTYSQMIRHICRQKDKEQGLQEFNNARYPEGKEPSSYGYVKKWFLTRYPDYNKPPAYDEKGKFITNLAEVREQKMIAQKGQ